MSGETVGVATGARQTVQRHRQNHRGEAEAGQSGGAATDTMIEGQTDQRRHQTHHGGAEAGHQLSAPMWDAACEKRSALVIPGGMHTNRQVIVQIVTETPGGIAGIPPLLPDPAPVRALEAP